MTRNVNFSGSYLQTNRHGNVSDRFNVVQPASIGQAMTNHGLNIVSLSTGRAKHADKADFQRTLSRYRGPEIAQGVFLDVVYDSKHMGRGVDKILLGIYRMICTNGLFVGMNFFKHEIRHSGHTYDSINAGIAAALTMQDSIARTIERMQRTQLDASQKEAFALEAVKLLTPANALQVRHRLLAPRRLDDQSNDLWTVYNVVQENGVQGRNVAYTLQDTDSNGLPNVRAMHARQIKPNTGKDADFNQALFDVALKFAA
jgi:hypothetical protein